MSYQDFTLESALSELGLSTSNGPVVQGALAVPVPDWLAEVIEGGVFLVPQTEKARSEFLVAPVLLAVVRASNGGFAVHSGCPLNVDADRELMGTCDFLLSRGPQGYLVRTPLLAVVEAKRADIELGLGQCVAQMVAARLVNERAKVPTAATFGCVTTGEVWQFLRLDGSVVTIDPVRLFLVNVGEVIGAFLDCLRQAASPGSPAT